MIQDSTSTRDGSAAGANAHGMRSLKSKAVEEFRRFFVLFLYLWILFGVFTLNQGVVMREHGINFPMLGFAFINALVFAKVMMLFEVFDPGRWLRKRPLIYPILYESLLLTIPLPRRPCDRKDDRRAVPWKDICRQLAGDGRRRSRRISEHHSHPVYRTDAVFRFA